MSTAAPAPSVAGTTRALARLVANPGLGGSLSALVVDQATGTPVFARTPTRALPPASTAKLLTAVAAIEALGPDATLRTEVRQAGSAVYLVGGGDVTLSRRRSLGYPPVASLTSLARSTAAAQPGNTPVTVCADSSLWSGPQRAPGWSSSYFTDGDIAQLSPLEVDEAHLQPSGRARSTTPAMQAAEHFATSLTADGIAATVGRAPECAPKAPATAVSVASAQSAPVSALVQRMLTDSDNDLAEALGRAVALHDGAAADFGGEAHAVTARVRALAGNADVLQLYDASGLSRLDRVDAGLLVALLRAAASPQHPELRSVIEGLPIAGLTGTLADRFRSRSVINAAGIVRAKTGNLIGVNTLAGVVVDAEGRTLLFAFMTAAAPSPEAGESALDLLAGRLATCGCR
jgi:D-alanyl-D-alanine carboxypeptidase/D-alanyl-D-alanine-endopeptidase (penicillin-binding protein 4)